jgi:Flagellar basal body-associated protein FliL
MADEPAEQTPVEEIVDESTPKPSRAGLFSLVKAIAFVSVVVIVEIVAASMLAPSAQQTERLAQQFVAATEGKTANVDEEGGEAKQHKSEEDVREVELGIYNITRYNPKTGTTMAIDFELFGTVLADDIAEFQHLFENNQARIREQVIMTLHSAESTDLTDAGLGLIKRKILEKTNRALAQPLLMEVLFSKFNFVER